MLENTKSCPAQSDRREFLRDAAAAAAAATLLPVVAQASEAAAAPAKDAKKDGADAYDPEQHRYAFVVDTTKCIGCGSCVRACKAENDVPDGFYRTWVERWILGFEESYVDSPKGALDGFGPVNVAFKPTKSFFVPKLCNHCKATPCIQVCPVGASFRTPDGVVLVDAERCIGCGYCVQACPFGSRFLDERTGCAHKCTWCYHRITKGLKPACVEVCPTGARLFGDVHHEDDPVRKIIEHERVSVLQPHLLTEPQAFYLGMDKEVR